MKRKYWFYSCTALVGIASAILWPTGVQTSEYSKPLTHSNTKLPKQVITDSDTPIVQNVLQEPEIELEVPNQPAMVSIDLTKVAQKHQATLQYPAYSQPITDSNSPYLSWNKFEEVAIPVLGGDSTASLSVNKYRHFFPDDIEVKLKSRATILGANLEVIAVETKQVLETLPSNDSLWTITPSESWPEEIRLVAKVEFEQGEDVVSADIRFYHSVANVINVEHGYADGADLRIPVVLETEQDGIYRVRGNLFDSNGVAIASLVAKERLTTGEQTIELKAFKNVLPAGSSELYLKNVMVERMSGYPGEKAGYGQSNAESYSIGSFDSNTLSDEDYQMSEQEKQRVAFLKQVF